jgi:fucose permease
LVRYPRRTNGGGAGISLRRAGSSAFGGPMKLFYLLMVVYVSIEVSIASWIVEYLQSARGLSVMASALYLSVFFGAITTGRLVGGLVVDRVGYVRAMFAASVAALACIGLGILGPPAFVLCIPLGGLFLSIMFPTATAAVSVLHGENTSTMLGLLFAFGGVGAMAGPWLVGAACDGLGVRAGFSVILAYCLILTLVLARLAFRLRSHSAAGRRAV